MRRKTELDFYCGVGIENGWMAQLDRPGKRLLDVFLQMRHYDRWHEDLHLAKDLGINAIRYSVPWYRANPAPGQYDWDWISQPVGWLTQNGITPIIDLIHYGTPTWMERGVLDPDFPERLAEYAHAFATRFAGEVNHYTPMNEPQASAWLSGLWGCWPPYEQGIRGWGKLVVPLARALALTSRALRDACRGCVLISAECTLVPDIREVTRELNSTQLDAESEFLFRYLPATLAYGRVKPGTPLARLLLKLCCSENDLAWFLENAAPPDVFGVNFYPNLETTSPEQARDDLLAELAKVHDAFGLPLYVTETSSGLTAEKKVQWVRALGDVVRRARERRLALRGVNWWPLYETIQWDYRDNGKPVEECIVPGGWNNGLYVIDKAGGRLDRVATAAVDEFRRLANELVPRRG